MFRPRALKKGDTIGLLAPSGNVARERIDAAVAAVKRMGFNVRLGRTCYLSHGYLAGSDDARASDINDMFADDEIDGIFAMRGGYGAQRILNKLDYAMIKKKAKTFAGYSDITALHAVFNQACGFITYHAPMPCTQFYKGVDDYTMDSFLNNIMRDKPVGKVSNPQGSEIMCLNPGVAEGRITGGNLSLIASSIGTPFEIETRGKIVFIEEIGEEPYKIDRMLNQLKLAGKFSDCAGIIFGAFTDCNAGNSNSLTIDEILNEIVAPEGIPTVYNIACGHCLPTLTIAMGAKVKLDAKNGEIIFS